MGLFNWRGWGRALLVAAALAVGAVCLLGCGGDDGVDDNPANNSGNNNNNTGGNNTFVNIRPTPYF